MAWPMQDWRTISISPSALSHKVKQSTAKMTYYITKIVFLSQIPNSDEFETEMAQLRQRFTGEGDGDIIHPGVP
jgi:hypothetical protein